MSACGPIQFKGLLPLNNLGGDRILGMRIVFCGLAHVRQQ